MNNFFLPRGGCAPQLTILVLVMLLSLTQGWTTTSRTTPFNRQYGSLQAHVSAIESTPNPSSFLLQLSAPLVGLEDMVGSLQGRSYSKISILTPTEIADILAIDGIESVYAMASALTINKKATAKWDALLPVVLKALGVENDQELLKGLPSSADGQDASTASSGQVRIRLQISNKMPIQIEGIGFLGTATRKKLAPKFAQHMELLVNGGADFFSDRKWVDRGMRYLSDEASVLDDEHDQENFELMTVLQAEFEEYDAAYSEERLAVLVAKQLGENVSMPSSTISPTSDSEMDLESVQQRCDLAEEGDVEALTILSGFVKSHKGNMAARRNALAYLGGTGSSFPGNELVFEAVVSALQNEKNPIMRRTAGDALSDLGDKRAVPCAIESLTDQSKLVQWRAARIVGELGDSMESAAALKEASFSSDYSFEVAFEIKDAMRKVRERALNKDAGIIDGRAAGPIWKQIQDGMAEKSSSSE
eukprot:CAMPEP_0119030742 /NCGR_PEP_ID=MMETSP1176-20130426/41186_1 /TAXON_ID=265551 /ORGANISM="Synedropsis recta cf, Strain CCMP1620" /LENGTH=475 /DNA_ID=CAMNT_0006987119 /DNA_START=214 /DNA_END=1641 /DNA_ORIENTATION=-